MIKQETEGVIPKKTGILPTKPIPSISNLIEDEKQKYEYDYKNKLIRVTDKVNTGKITEFVYDVLGRRIEKKVGNIQTIKYTYSNENILIEQTQRDDKTYTKRYVNGIGTDEVLGYENESLGMNEAEYRENLFCKNTVLPNQTDFESFGYTGILNRCAELGAIANNSEITKSVYYFGKDHLGNIVSLTNETGKLLLKYEYDSFGKVYVKTGSG